MLLSVEEEPTTLQPRPTTESDLTTYKPEITTYVSTLVPVVTTESDPTTVIPTTQLDSSIAPTTQLDSTSITPTTESGSTSMQPTTHEAISVETERSTDAQETTEISITTVNDLIQSQVTTMTRATWDYLYSHEQAYTLTDEIITIGSSNGTTPNRSISQTISRTLPCTIIPTWLSVIYHRTRYINDTPNNVIYGCEPNYEFADKYEVRSAWCDENGFWRPAIQSCVCE